MAKFDIKVGGKVHQSTQHGTIDKDKFKVTEKGKEQQDKQQQDKQQKK